MKKLINFEVIYFQFNTDETQTLIFPIFYMLIEYLFHARIHDTNIIPEWQAKHKLIKI